MSDMRITFREDSARRPSYVSAALKTVLINPSLCLGYAGDRDTALDGIRFVATHGLDGDAASEHLQDVHIRGRGVADFVIASIRPSKLVVVKDEAATETEAGWIGDQAAFEDYQAEYFRDRGPALPAEFCLSAAHAQDIETASRMSNALGAVVHGSPFTPEGRVVIPSGGRHNTVGEAVVAVVPRIEDGLLKYSDQSRAQSSGFAEPLPPGPGGVVPPDWGSAARGSFSYSMLVPREPGVGAIGLYFIEGRFGVLYAPLLATDAETFPNITVEAFAEIVRLRHGIELSGLGVPANLTARSGARWTDRS
jgi:hypothetical protein